MNNEFKIIILFKEYIFYFNKFIDNYPNKEIIKKRIINLNYDILEEIYYINLLKNKKDNIYFLISKINMLNVYLEISLKSKYISIKVFNHLCNMLNTITKMIYGWLKYDN